MYFSITIIRGKFFICLSIVKIRYIILRKEIKENKLMFPDVFKSNISVNCHSNIWITEVTMLSLSLYIRTVNVKHFSRT